MNKKDKRLKYEKKIRCGFIGFSIFPCERSECGLTLLEIVVSLGIFLMLAAGVYLFVIQGYRSQETTLHQTQAITEAQRGIDTFKKQLRDARTADNGAYPLVLADDQQLTFYSDIDADQQAEHVRLWLNGTDLMHSTIEPSGSPITYPVGNEVTKIIARDLENGSNPVFIYFDGNAAATSGTPLSTPADVTKAKLVMISLQIDADVNRPPDEFVLTSSVQIRNLKDNL